MRHQPRSTLCSASEIRGCGEKNHRVAVSHLHFSEGPANSVTFLTRTSGQTPSGSAPEQVARVCAVSLMLPLETEEEGKERQGLDDSQRLAYWSCPLVCQAFWFNPNWWNVTPFWDLKKCRPHKLHRVALTSDASLHCGPQLIQTSFKPKAFP